MPPGIEGQRPVGGNTPGREGGTAGPAEKSNNATYRGTSVSGVDKVTKKSQAPQDEVGEKIDTPIEKRNIRQDSNGASGRYSSARARRREKNRLAEEGREKVRPAADRKNQDSKISEGLASIAEDSGISGDESIAGPPHSPKANNWVKEYDRQTFHLPKFNQLLKRCWLLHVEVKKLDEYQGRKESDYLTELERLETVYAENTHDDDRKIEHYLASDKAFTGISKGNKRLKQEMKRESRKEGVKSLNRGAGKIVQEIIDRAMHQKRPLHPVRHPPKTPETAPVKDTVIDPVMAKVEGDFNSTLKLVENLESEVTLSTASQYAAAKELFKSTLLSSQWAKETMAETHSLQQQIQTVKATVFKELNIPDHQGSEPLVDPHITDSAYVSALEAAVETIGMAPSAARESVEKHPAMQKHLKELGYQENRESPECLEYLDKLDDMEQLPDKEYLEKLKDLKDPQFMRGFSDGLRLKWLAKHLSQTFRRYSDETIRHPTFQQNKDSLLDTLNAREQNIGDKLKTSAEYYKSQCKELKKTEKLLARTMKAYKESGKDGIDILRQREVLARAKKLRESMQPVHDQIKLVTSYQDPQMQCAWLQKQCYDLDKQHASLQKSIQECQVKLDKAKGKGKPLEDIQNKMNNLNRASANIASQLAAQKQEYVGFRQALNRYYKIQLDMDIKLFNRYSDPGQVTRYPDLQQECDALKKQYAAEDKQHASVQKSIKKCQEKLDKAKRKGGDIEVHQEEMDNLKIQSAEHEKKSADLKSQYAELSQALKRWDMIQLGLNEKQLGIDGDE